jgi:hypothetical protein
MLKNTKDNEMNFEIFRDFLSENTERIMDI